MRSQLGHLIALGTAVAVVARGPDTAAAFSTPRGGVSYGATVVQQVDGQTFWIDLGPAKGSDPRGVVLAHANRFTRFNLSAGVFGSQNLVELTTNTR